MTNHFLLWENHNFPITNEVYSLTPDGRVRDYDYEQTMKNMKSVIALWEEQNGRLERLAVGQT